MAVEVLEVLVVQLLLLVALQILAAAVEVSILPILPELVAQAWWPSPTSLLQCLSVRLDSPPHHLLLAATRS
jgi:hypothetical protein